ncbi:hypothetical protein [Inquilinus limosus]|nr:hypothetical protein [Inquilinus limosus]
MSGSHSISVPANDRPDTAQGDPVRAEWVLGRLADMTMERCEALHGALLAAIKAGDFRAVRMLDLAIDRAARCLRRTLVLEDHFARQREAGLDPAEEDAIRQAEATDTRRGEAADDGAVERDPAIGGDRVERAGGMRERLLETDDIKAALALAKLPLDEIVLRLCRGMGARPDPSWGINDPEGEDDRLELVWWPADGPKPGRYASYKEGRKAVPIWVDLSTKTRLAHPPWG